MDRSIQEKIRQAGIVGAGGAGFPTYQKMADGIDSVLINAVECEPLLHTDYAILKLHLDEVVQGAKLLAEALGAKRTLLCVKKGKAGLIGLEDGQSLSAGVFAKTLPDVYPMGDEIIMIHEALGRTVPPGSLPSSVGSVVANAETALNIWRALVKSAPVSEKWLTIGGAVKKACVVKAPIGEKALDLLKSLGEGIPPGHVLIDGGPAMGKIVNVATATVSKTTKGLIVLPADCSAAAIKRMDASRQVKRALSACCQCTFCTDLCPRQLLGYPLRPHACIQSASTSGMCMPESILTASLCSGCNLCTLAACCQGVAPSIVIGQIRSELIKNGYSYHESKPAAPSSMRQYRMVPSSRFERLAGVSQFAVEAPFIGAAVNPGSVRLLLRQHLGQASVPIVEAGQKVKRNQMIAEPADGLSVALHASIGGVVAGIDEGGIDVSAE
ncbi:MAG: hypothetical protein LBU32_30555 [Clostridiales bacterium]|jgi:Na+-translocating ferredoxin:NAD+ oxidoreductase RnfC subunit|nr:hypothetical protein [Clostridiales bacterium]